MAQRDECSQVSNAHKTDLEFTDNGKPQKVPEAGQLERPYRQMPTRFHSESERRLRTTQFWTLVASMCLAVASTVVIMDGTFGKQQSKRQTEDMLNMMLSSERDWWLREIGDAVDLSRQKAETAENRNLNPPGTGIPVEENEYFENKASPEEPVTEELSNNVDDSGTEPDPESPSQVEDSSKCQGLNRHLCVAEQASISSLKDANFGPLVDESILMGWMPPAPTPRRKGGKGKTIRKKAAETEEVVKFVNQHLPDSSLASFNRLIHSTHASADPRDLSAQGRERTLFSRFILALNRYHVAKQHTAAIMKSYVCLKKRINKTPRDIVMEDFFKKCVVNSNLLQYAILEQLQEFTLGIMLENSSLVSITSNLIASPLFGIVRDFVGRDIGSIIARAALTAPSVVESFASVFRKSQYLVVGNMVLVRMIEQRSEIQLLNSGSIFNEETRDMNRREAVCRAAETVFPTTDPVPAWLFFLV